MQCEENTAVTTYQKLQCKWNGKRRLQTVISLATIHFIQHSGFSRCWGLKYSLSILHLPQSLPLNRSAATTKKAANNKQKRPTTRRKVNNVFIPTVKHLMALHPFSGQQAYFSEACMWMAALGSLTFSRICVRTQPRVSASFSLRFLAELESYPANQESDEWNHSSLLLSVILQKKNICKKEKKKREKIHI